MNSLPDYSSLIDEQTQAFIEQTERWYPPDTIDFTLARQREIYNNMCREFHHGHPAGVTAADDIISYAEADIPVRRYGNQVSNASSRIIYFHGGGFVVGGLESHDDVCAELCKRTELAVTAIDYRLAPEHVHPAAFNDAVAAVLNECRAFNQDAILCGDSAGGNLAAAVSHKLRNTAAPGVTISGQVLIYPALADDFETSSSVTHNTSSYIVHANAPMLTTREAKFYLDIRTGHKPVDDIVSIAPLNDTDFSKLPKTIVFSAECDPLCDDGRHYCEAITAAGGNAQHFMEKGLVHGYLRARHSVDRARNSFDRIVACITELS